MGGEIAEKLKILPFIFSEMLDVCPTRAPM